MTATIFSLPNEILEATLTSRRWTLQEVKTMLDVCLAFRNIVTTTRKLRIVVPAYKTRLEFGKELLSLNPNITVDVDGNDGRCSFSPVPLWIWYVEIPGTIYNATMWHSDHEPALDRIDAEAVNAFLDQNAKNRISMKHYEYELSEASIILEHGDPPSDYDAIERAFQRLGVAPRVLVYRKRGFSGATPTFKNEDFKKRHVFPTVTKLILEDFTFDEFMRLKGDRRFPSVPNAEEFECNNRRGDFVDFWHEDHEELIRATVLPLLRSDKSYRFHSTWSIKADADYTA